MGVAKEYRKKHWVIALDADLAAIPNPQIGDTALTEDKNKLYYKTSAGWKTGLGYEYVPRDVVANDWIETDFTRDGADHVDGLDTTAIVPDGAVAIHFSCFARASAASKIFTFTKNATHIQNQMKGRSQVANIYISELNAIVACDANRLLDYNIDATFNALGLKVVGWFI